MGHGVNVAIFNYCESIECFTLNKALLSVERLMPAITSQRKPQAVAGLVNCDVMAAVHQPKNRSHSS
jgi:hypothetical protein